MIYFRICFLSAFCPNMADPRVCHHKPLLLPLSEHGIIRAASCHFNMFPDIIWGICPPCCSAGTSLTCACAGCNPSQLC